MPTPVLHINENQTIFVIDIPASIEAAQGGGRIYSAASPHTPYRTPEPKGHKRDIWIASSPPEDREYHGSIQDEIKLALGVIRASTTPLKWCLPRVQGTEYNVPSNIVVTAQQNVQVQIPTVLSWIRNEFDAPHEVQHELVSNPGPAALLVLGNTTNIFIPARCVFIWSDIHFGLNIIQNFERTIESDLRFDIILLDPPWSNRSVRNARSYSTINEQASDPFVDALKLVQKYHATAGRVALWITNKPAIRQRVLASMTALSFLLVEEWIWVKITSEGEPVTPLDGVWRKPYEILLLFQHAIVTSSVTRRLLFAVPDVHSRKPNLRVLFGRLFDPSRVLELFARNLTSDWWCLGDEVLKFQECKLWHELPYYENILPQA